MDKLEYKLNSIQNKLGGTKPTPDVIDKLGWHLDYIEELIQSGTKLPYPVEGDEGKVPTVNEDLSFEYKEKADLVGGKVPASQLPSYVDDVLEFSDVDHLPSTGEEGKIYVALDTGFTYRWSGSEYVQIGGQDLSNYVTLDTDQTVPGVKTFSNGLKTGTTYILKEDMDYLAISNGLNNIALFGNYFSMLRTSLPTSTNYYDLGSSSLSWKDLYLSGNISDGTNSVTVAHLATNTPAQWYGTQAEYDALGTYDSNTIYNILEE